MSEASLNIKADTFHISDTIFFLTTITPNKVIKVQDYHWLMDGKYCSSEYNFKKQIDEPGHHKFTFVLKDYFGDMHYDSLDVWVATNPTLNDSAYIPADGTQAIDPYETIYFTWNAKTEGIALSHYYRFTLSEQSFANSEAQFQAIDTILDESHFIFHSKLNSLKKYNWTVQAYNEYKLASEGIIESSFYTKGLPGEGSLQASIDIGQASSIPVLLSLQDKKNPKKNFEYKFNLSKSNSDISLGAIPAGSYQLSLNSSNSDFGTVYKDIEINDGFVTIANNFKFVDSIAPTITSVNNIDTLDFADSLQFIIKDGSGFIANQNITASLESEQIPSRTYKDSILTIFLKETDKSWTYRILAISATDGSKNTRTKFFYIKPSSLWFTTNNDTTITRNDRITFFIRENNPFGFEVNSFKFENITLNKILIIATGAPGNSFETSFMASSFKEEQLIKSTVIYKNGMQQSKTWKLSIVPTSTQEEE
jgi:hypothetical protein